MLKEQFNELPIEMQSNILRFNPHMRSINKTFYHTTKQYYYDEYCQLPISKHEFINYINEYEPEQFAMFVDKGDTYKMLLFTSFGDMSYQMMIMTFSENNVDIDEYKIIFDYSHFNIHQFKDLLFTIEHNFKYPYYFDVQLTKNIVKQRSCYNINQQYADDYINNYLQKFIHVNEYASDMDNIFDLIKKSFYLNESNEIYNKYGVILHYRNAILDIIYNHMGDSIDDDYDIDVIIKELIDDINEMYNIIQHL